MSGGVPPSSRAGKRRKQRARENREVNQAADLYERFSGHDAEPIGRVHVPALPKAGVAIGHCTAICYRTVRDGVEEHYIHEFADKDAPLFVVSPNGKQILLVGGNFRFTERGIVDASWRD